MCILLGCDYCDTIRGVGPQKALSLIREKGSISEILKGLDGKFVVPPDFPYENTQHIFKNAEYTDPDLLEVPIFYLYI